MNRRPLSAAGKFWLGYFALVIAAGFCALVH
jgi:hypothetical protein